MNPEIVEQLREIDYLISHPNHQDLERARLLLRDLLKKISG